MPEAQIWTQHDPKNCGAEARGAWWICVPKPSAPLPHSAGRVRKYCGKIRRLSSQKRRHLLASSGRTEEKIFHRRNRALAQPTNHGTLLVNILVEKPSWPHADTEPSLGPSKVRSGGNWLLTSGMDTGKSKRVAAKSDAQRGGSKRAWDPDGVS